jgi:hypothetical protein
MAGQSLAAPACVAEAGSQGANSTDAKTTMEIYCSQTPVWRRPARHDDDEMVFSV